MSHAFRLLRPLLAALFVLALAGACSSASEGSGNPGQDTSTVDSGGVQFQPVDTQDPTDDVITGEPDLVEPPADTSEPTPDLGGGDPVVGEEPDCVTRRRLPGWLPLLREASASSRAGSTAPGTTARPTPAPSCR